MKRKIRNVQPGEILKMELVDGRKLSVSKIAQQLRATEIEISQIISGDRPITPEIALKLEISFGGSAKHFLNLQNNYNLNTEF